MESPSISRSGYPALAELMARYPEVALFRTFRERNILNLLRLQADIQDVEQQLEAIQDEDARDYSSDRCLFEKDFMKMRECKKRGGDSLQHELLENMGRKLSEYSNLTLSID